MKKKKQKSILLYIYMYILLFKVTIFPSLIKSKMLLYYSKKKKKQLFVKNSNKEIQLYKYILLH